MILLSGIALVVLGALMWCPSYNEITGQLTIALMTVFLLPHVYMIQEMLSGSNKFAGYSMNAALLLGLKNFLFMYIAHQHTKEK